MRLRSRSQARQRRRPGTSAHTQREEGAARTHVQAGSAAAPPRCCGQGTCQRRNRPAAGRRKGLLPEVRCSPSAPSLSALHTPSPSSPLNASIQTRTFSLCFLFSSAHDSHIALVRLFGYCSKRFVFFVFFLVSDGLLFFFFLPPNSLLVCTHRTHNQQ